MRQGRVEVQEAKVKAWSQSVDSARNPSDGKRMAGRAGVALPPKKETLEIVAREVHSQNEIEIDIQRGRGEGGS